MVSYLNKLDSNIYNKKQVEGLINQLNKSALGKLLHFGYKGLNDYHVPCHVIQISSNFTNIEISNILEHVTDRQLWLVDNNYNESMIGSNSNNELFFHHEVKDPFNLNLENISKKLPDALNEIRANRIKQAIKDMDEGVSEIDKKIIESGGAIKRDSNSGEEKILDKVKEFAETGVYKYSPIRFK